MANLETFGWNWHAFAGSAHALKWNRRDLPCLEAVIAQTPGRTVAVQAGGNLGIFPKRLARDFATVYTFEPAADLFAMLVRNAPEPNIVKFQAAVGDSHEGVSLSRIRRDDKPHHHEGITHVCGPGAIPTLRIDDLGLRVCDLICLDVEGWECQALRGAAATIARCRPVVVVEVNKNTAFVGVTLDQVRALVTVHGYRFVARLRSDELYVPAERAA